MKEIWKPVAGFEGLYEVSNLGSVASLHYKGGDKRGLLKPKKHNCGYYSVCLCKDKRKYDFLIHRLVADTFIPNPNNFPQVNHKNEDKHDNRVKNLEWCTAQYNMTYGTGKQREAEKKRGKTNTGRSRPVIATLPDGTEELYPSMKEFGRLQGMKNNPAGNIIKVINGTWKTAYGRTWRYANET